jgi:uncharacterized protein (DUF58 family)
MIKNRDSVGFLLYSDNIHTYIPPDNSGKGIDRLEKEVSSIIPSGGFSAANAIKYLQTKQKKKVLLFLITASLNSVEALSYYNNLTVFLINHESYYDCSPNGDFEDLLIRNSQFKEINRVRRTVNAIRNRGIRCVYVNKKNMLPKIMFEYNYGRSMNKGAS